MKPLFQTRASTLRRYAYDVSPDGQRFLISTDPDAATLPLTLLTNWPALLKK